METIDSHTIRVRLQSVPEVASHPAVVNHASMNAGMGLHLAVMTGPYLDRIIAGTKTVESRFHKIRSAPLNTVGGGDLVVFKPSGRAVSHVAGVSNAIYIDLASTPLNVVRRQWQDKIGDTADEFWSARAQARWVSLIEIDWIKSIPPIVLEKRDRRAWITYTACCPGDTLF
jgi:hypothetical protein